MTKKVPGWYMVALASLAVETVLSAKVPITSCPLNHYAVLNDDGSGRISECRVCDSCPPGYGAVEACSATANTVCLPCSMGKFSRTVSATDKCQSCQTCRDQVMVKECSPISDTVCSMECPLGEYFDPTTLSCKRCSYCFPEHLYARTSRVLDCQRQGLHIDYQCSPLPRADAVGIVHPQVVTADRHRSAAAARRHHDRTVHTSSLSRAAQGTETSERGASGHPREDPRIHNVGRVVPSTIPLFWSTKAPPLFEATTTKPAKLSDLRISPAKSREQVTSGEFYKSGKQATRTDDVKQSFIEQIKQEFDTPIIPKAGKQGSIIPYYHSMTSTDIVLLVVILIIVMLISIVITAISCYCWIRRGKSLHGHKVKAISSKPPSNAWTYQDMMPSLSEIHPLVKDTPPQSRKLITCV